MEPGRPAPSDRYAATSPASGEELSDSAINARARLADALARLIEADARVRRWRRVEFAEDGGAVVVVELHHDSGGISHEVVARELEFKATSALPKLPWVRVQAGGSGAAAGPRR